MKLKKMIIEMEKDWIAFLFGVVGVLLILFPNQLMHVAPVLVGTGLVLRGLLNLLILWRYPNEKLNPGKIVLYLVLGAAILRNAADSIGVIGVIWAMLSLNEVEDDINEAVKNHHISVFRTVMVVITIALALMLLFDPSGHFALHVRILGLEMLASVFVRWHESAEDEG